MVAIEAEHVGKSYRTEGGDVGLHDLSVQAEAGTVLALLGPNGAGKSTAVRGLSTLLSFDRGRARVAGHDIRTQAREVRERIALVGQSAAVDDQLTATQNLVLFGRLRGMGRADARARASQLLDQFGLAESDARAVRGFSGGMRRRLDVAASMLVRPEILFVDEPTTGLDPMARRDLWQIMRAMVEEGTTILLTTQYLEEADALADHVILLGRGEVIAEGSPDQLKSMVGPPVIQLVFECGAQADLALSALRRTVRGAVLKDLRTVAIEANYTDVLARCLEALRDVSASPIEVNMGKPSLDDAFVRLTGHQTHPTEEKA